MVSAFTPVGGAFQSGVNFVLYKPLAYEQVARSLRAGQGFMKPTRGMRRATSWKRWCTFSSEWRRCPRSCLI